MPSTLTVVAICGRQTGRDCTRFRCSRAVCCAFMRQARQDWAKWEFTDIREDCNGRIYVASVGGGIYRLDEKKHAFQVFDTDNSDIMSNFCYAFANVGKQLIYSTEHGIGVLNTTDDSFRNVEFSHDFPIIGINRGCGLFAVGNTILVGGTNGMVAMDVSRLLDTRTHGRRLCHRQLYTQLQPAAFRIPIAWLRQYMVYHHWPQHILSETACRQLYA